MKIKELYNSVNDGKIVSDIELQREIVYDPEKQTLVIDSIIKGIPLPAFYFWKNTNGILEVLDGKQRIEAIKNFYQNNIMYNSKLWLQTYPDIQEKINNTEIKDITCEGTEQLKSEKIKLKYTSEHSPILSKQPRLTTLKPKNSTAPRLN